MHTGIFPEKERVQMLKLDFDRNQIEDAIDRIVHKTMNMDLTWDWPAVWPITAYPKLGRLQRKKSI